MMKSARHIEFGKKRRRHCNYRVSPPVRLMRRAARWEILLVRQNYEVMVVWQEEP